MPEYRGGNRAAEMSWPLSTSGHARVGKQQITRGHRHAREQPLEVPPADPEQAGDQHHVTGSRALVRPTHLRLFSPERRSQAADRLLDASITEASKSELLAVTFFKWFCCVFF